MPPATLIFTHGTTTSLATVTTQCGTWPYAYQDVSVEVGITFSFFVQGTYAYGDTLVYMPDTMQIYGHADASPSEGEEVPTSTYSGFQASDFITFGWTNNALAGSSTEWTNHVEGYIGPATDTFPLCFAYPFWGLLDTLQSSMVTGTTEGITFQGGFLQGNTTTLTLESAPGVLQATGFRRIEDLVLPWVEAMFWCVFGVFVFLKLFGKCETDDSVTDETT